MIQVDKRLQDEWFWKEKPFSKGQAWVDLMLLADNETHCNDWDSEDCKRTIKLNISCLSEKWGWNRPKTYRFVEELEKYGLITLNVTPNVTLITIEKYTFSGNDVTPECYNVTPTSQKRVNYREITDMFNDICQSFPKIRSLSNTRKKAIKARLNMYSIKDLQKAFEKAEASDFLKGKNNRNWQANFDWIIKDANLAKVLDGNYDNAKGYTDEKYIPKLGTFL